MDFDKAEARAFEVVPVEVYGDEIEVDAACKEIEPRAPLTVGMNEIIALAGMPLPWSVKRYLIANTLTIIYGPPKHYKTFVALDLALSQASGLPFLGQYEVLKPGLVIYCAGEGVSGIGQRILAWCKARDIEPMELNFRRTTGPIQISEGGAFQLAKECEEISNRLKLPIVGIYVDTLARNFGSGDENSTQDMNTFIRQCDIHLRERFQAAVVIVHHSGHDNAKRARGAIALMGAADSQIRVTCDFPYVTVTTDFMKDAEAPDPCVLEVQKVPLGFDDQFGEPVKSVVLELTDRTPSTEKVALSGDEEMALSHLTAEWKLYAVWRDDFYYEAEKTPVRKGKNKGKPRCKGSLRSVVSRVIDSLEKKGAIEVDRCNGKEVTKLRLAVDPEALQE